MEVILLEKIKKLGDLGDTVKVAPGYGRNFLLPQGKALPATEANKAVFEARKAELVKKASDSLNVAKLRAAGINGKTLQIKVLASEEGKLYGSVGVSEIIEAAIAAGLDLHRNEISLVSPFREVGDFEVTISLHTEVEATIKVVVESQRSAAAAD